MTGATSLINIVGSPLQFFRSRAEMSPNWKLALAPVTAAAVMTVMAAGVLNFKAQPHIEAAMSEMGVDMGQVPAGAIAAVGLIAGAVGYLAMFGAMALTVVVLDLLFAQSGRARRLVEFSGFAFVSQLPLAVLGLALQPILAVGEQQEEREGGRTAEVLRRQLDAAFADIDRLPEGFTIAYEPVWAIGTGLTATPEIAQATVAEIRRMVADRFGAASAEACRIQYGGSVNAGNVADLASQRDIDGALVGGASLDAEAFATICRAVAAAAE